MKIKIFNAIIGINLLSALLIIFIVYFPSNTARLILGMPFMLFIPGFALTAVFIRLSDNIDVLERIALSSGLSIAIVALIGLGLNFTPWGIMLDSTLYSIAAFTLVTSIIALIKNTLNHRPNKLMRDLFFKIPAWRSSKSNKAISLILILAILGAGGILGYEVNASNPAEAFSEFYILGIDQKARDYPTVFTMKNGQTINVLYGSEILREGPGKITLGIINHERHKTAYTLKLRVDNESVSIFYAGKSLEKLGPVELANGEKWEQEIEFSPLHTGLNQKVEIQLFKDGNTSPENSLNLWTNVN